MILTLDHIQITAPIGREDECRKFWGDLLQLQEIEKPKELRDNGGCWFTIGSIDLHIGIEEPFSPNKKAHPAFQVKDLGALQAVLTKAGYPIKEATPLPYAKRFFTTDPFGNRLEFLSLYS
ncbi:hypothetical protein JCM19037_1074 [Geomicrobium sp. JCM 19037]|uniref:VOC family protein n=1 Tax=unclassified Geomicrobium TaxID=2628951 RepID=UPI00045F4976|nr:VOC family protein [Geomicrobium sp. JCM 19037]GAK02812.1 hypothetical protein JCM19037_1074 [Geomicrobium sp. JCM 19037]